MTTCRSFFPGASELEAGATSDPSILDHPHYTKKKEWEWELEERYSPKGWVVRVWNGEREYERVSKMEKSGNTGGL